MWWIGFDPAVGSEIRKTRLAAIVRTMRPAGISAHSHGASDQQHREAVPGEAVVTISEQRSKAMAAQIMSVDKLRLKSQLYALSKADILAVEDAIKVHLTLPR